MKTVIFAAAVIVLCAAIQNRLLSEEPESEPQVVRTFVGTVEQIVYLSDFKASAIAADPDPRWVVTVSLTTEQDDGKKKRETLSFAIHSAVKLFAMTGDEAKGKSFRFVQTHHKPGETNFNLSAQRWTPDMDKPK